MRGQSKVDTNLVSKNLTVSNIGISYNRIIECEKVLS